LKPESKLWLKVKRHTPNITWTRVESWASFGFPDLVGYTEKRGFFTMELKVTKSKKLTFSPHQIAFHIKHPTNTFILAEHLEQRAIKLYEGNQIQELVACGLSLDACCLTLDALEERLLLEPCALAAVFFHLLAPQVRLYPIFNRERPWRPQREGPASH